MSINFGAWLELLEILFLVFLGWILSVSVFAFLIWLGWSLANGPLGLPDLSYPGALGLCCIIRGLKGAWRGFNPAL